MALRLVLRMISEIANRQQKYIVPMLSLTVDFYVRLFIRVHEGAKQCHDSIAKYSNVFQCFECEAHYLHPMGIHTLEETTFDEKGKKTARKKRPLPGAAAEEEEKDEEGVAASGGNSKVKDKYRLPLFKIPSSCKVCDGPLIMGGPIWSEPIHDLTFVTRLLEATRKNAAGENGHKVKTTERITAILTAVIDEHTLAGKPLSYELSHIASTLKIHNPRKGQLFAAFNSLGYLLRQTYYDSKLFKTNAPPEVIYDIFKAWKSEVY
jgi:tRNA (guanine26-N2/guanine27-N2)-dimethyltransferase